MPSLYDFLDVEARLKTVFTDETELTDEELNELLKIKADNKRDIEEKLVGYAKFIKQIDGEITPIEAEIKRLQRRKNSRKNLIERMKEAMKYASRVAKITKTVDAVGNGMRRQNIAARVIVKSEAHVPPEFTKYTAKWATGQLDFMAMTELSSKFGVDIFTREIDKRRIKKFWQDSDEKEVPDGVEIEDGRQTIVIL